MTEVAPVVEAEEPIEVSPEDQKDAGDLLLSLLAIDRKAKSQGSSLAQMLYHLGLSGLGVDCRPDPEE